MGEVTRYLTTRAEVEALCKAAHSEGARQERERERENTIAMEGAGIRWDEVDADMKYEGRCVAVKIERGKVEHAAALARVRAEAVREWIAGMTDEQLWELGSEEWYPYDRKPNGGGMRAGVATPAVMRARLNALTPPAGEEA